MRYCLVLALDNQRDFFLVCLQCLQYCVNSGQDAGGIEGDGYSGEGSPDGGPPGYNGGDDIMTFNIILLQKYILLYQLKARETMRFIKGLYVFSLSLSTI